jgi:hypothetical protein
MSRVLYGTRRSVQTLRSSVTNVFMNCNHSARSLLGNITVRTTLLIFVSEFYSRDLQVIRWMCTVPMNLISSWPMNLSVGQTTGLTELFKWRVTVMASSSVVTNITSSCCPTVRTFTSRYFKPPSIHLILTDPISCASGTVSATSAAMSCVARGSRTATTSACTFTSWDTTLDCDTRAGSRC